jgi:hypothetical protein
VSAEHHPARRWRRLAAAAAIVTGTTAFGITPAHAAPPAAAPRAAAVIAAPGQQVAAALRKSPLYVDPSLSAAFPPSVRASLLRQIRKAPVPVFVLAIPLVSGGQWPSGDQLATVVHNDLGRPGVYITLDAEISSDIDAFTWPSDPQGIDAAPYHAADAAQAANLAQDMQNATVPDKLIRCIQLISNGQAVAADNAAQRQLNQDEPTPSASGQPSGGGSGALLITLIAIVVAVLGVGALLLVRRRRRPSPFVTPHAVFAAARNATESELREQAQQQVIELGELVERPGAPLSDAARELITRALDAYQAAGKVLDSASGLADLAGVLVLTHLGRAAAVAAQAGQDTSAAFPLCFFNPLHGEGVREIHWRALGERRTLDVHVCQECADATAQHRLPDVLTDQAGGQAVPYYEVDPDRSVWAATGYGQFGADLVQRILTRGPHPAR